MFPICGKFPVLWDQITVIFPELSGRVALCDDYNLID